MKSKKFSQHAPSRKEEDDEEVGMNNSIVFVPVKLRVYYLLPNDNICYFKLIIDGLICEYILKR